MDEKKIITEYFANDDPPAKINKIAPLSDFGEHYFAVHGEDHDGTFETEVFVDGLSVVILPE